MANSPMVIAWPYQNSLHMSQRQATGEVQPTVVSNPTVQASFVGDGSAINGSYTRFSFSVVDNNAAGPVDVIWAYVRLLQPTRTGRLSLEADPLELLPDCAPLSPLTIAGLDQSQLGRSGRQPPAAQVGRRDDA